MAGLLADLKASIDSALVGELSPATYWQASTTGYDIYGNPEYSWASFNCEGLRASWDALYAASGAIPIDAARIEIIASTLEVQVQQDDRIYIEGLWWRISRFELDPASAMWICQCSDSEAPT